MTETTEEPEPEEEEQPEEGTPKKKVSAKMKKRYQTKYSKLKQRVVGFKTKMALLEVIERKRLSDRVDYAAISARTHVSCGALRRVYMQWKRGEVDIGDPTTPEEKQIDARMQHERSIILLRRYKALVLNGFEGALLASEDDMSNGKPKGYVERGMPAMIRELQSLTQLQMLHEKGYMSVLEDLMAQRQREEKQLTAAPLTPETVTQIIHANDEEKARAALMTE